MRLSPRAAWHVFSMALVVGLAHLIAIPPTSAKIVELSYTSEVARFVNLWHDVAAAHRLTDEDAALARRMAATWIFIGPCRGSVNVFADPRQADGAMQFVFGARPSAPVGAATLHMIAILTRENLGREPGEYVCRFAREMAVPL